ncbi:isocitrate lyase/phosphoenolpyruvate mutase family protein [Streptomyces sp. SBT349]|uniref:isocitrate lyase/phosphoenolpyruvate mutase family protein n=1 Tax=Streptomyces sp. SBT349 TaxID=1580539 RepID=UPI00066EF2ED|nr:isocitrate lyase/phosphoenolpyruvate mutase family protein [Streptomyces sp. SBT349]
MLKRSYPSFRTVLGRHDVVRLAGAHHALSGVLAQEAGFEAVWSSSFEVSAARCLPDASILTMTEFLEAAANLQKALDIPVVVDCDTGYGGNYNVAHMVHEFEGAGITAVCMEDKLFPKLNSFANGSQALLPMTAFASKIQTAKAVQSTEDFFVIARTEALIAGMEMDEAVTRCQAYADAGADAVLIHSKQPTRDEVLTFLDRWDDRVPVVIVPTTYPDWHIDEVCAAGVSVVIYANHGMRATLSALRKTYRAIYEAGNTTALEPEIASVRDIFDLQRMADWQKLDA